MISNDEKYSGNPLLHKICTGYVGVVLSCLGLIGNIISVAVWKRINRKRSDSSKSAGIYLITLAIVDSGLLIFFLLTECIQQLVKSILNHSIYVKFYCYFGYPAYFFFVIASISMVICITYNRFIAVLFPHHAPRLNSIRNTYIFMAIMLFFSFGINIPHFFNYQQKVNGSGFEPTKYGSSSASQHYEFWMHCMILVLIPWFIIFGLNSAIIYRLVTKEKLRVKPKGELKRERQTTIMLMTITITFLIFLLWQCLTQCFWLLGYGKNDEHVWFNVDSAYGPARLGVVLNSSVNFLLYCLSGSMFRKALWKMCIECCCCGSDSNNYNRFSNGSSSLLSTTTRTSSPTYSVSIKSSNTCEGDKTIKTDQDSNI